MAILFKIFSVNESDCRYLLSLFPLVIIYRFSIREKNIMLAIENKTFWTIADGNFRGVAKLFDLRGGGCLMNRCRRFSTKVEGIFKIALSALAFRI